MEAVVELVVMNESSGSYTVFNRVDEAVSLYFLKGIYRESISWMVWG